MINVKSDQLSVCSVLDSHKPTKKKKSKWMNRIGLYLEGMSPSLQKQVKYDHFVCGAYGDVNAFVTFNVSEMVSL